MLRDPYRGVLKEALAHTEWKSHLKKKFSNSKGEVFYGMHMYPGVCEYNDPKIGTFRVFLNEETIRDMDRTFPGKPIYVDHVAEVPEDIDDMKLEADGYVVDSFYNAADGKHWAKFVMVSKKGLTAIQQGYRLSNTYIAESYDRGGRWNHVPYQKQVTKATYEHLALVQSPRYDESVVLTPEEFKSYNERHELDLKRYANEKEKDDEMKFEFFKKEKLSNSSDLALTSVVLPKSGKEYTITRLVNAMDEVEVARTEAPVLDTSLRLKVGESEMTVEELKSAYLALAEEIKALKEEVDEDLDEDEEYEDDDETFDNEDDDEFDNSDEDEEIEKKKKMKNKADEDDLAAKKKKSEDAKKDKKQNSLSPAEKAARARADKLRDAKRQHRMENSSVSKVETRGDQIARGLARYGR